MAFLDPMSHQRHLHFWSLCRGCIELIQPFGTVCVVGNLVLAVNLMNLIADAYNTERCDVSLIKENTNTKHTHKWSEAQ